MKDHPDGPRTLWTMVRDNLPLTQQAVARGLELEQGRHPTMTDLRRALGFDLDTGGVWEAVRRVRLPRDATPDDALLMRFLDEMYRGLASSRLVRVVLSEAGIETSSPGDTVRARAGEALYLFVFVDNQRANEANVAVEAGSASGTLAVEAGRTASLLLEAGAIPEGAAGAVVSVDCDGRSVAESIAIETDPSWTLSARIVDGGGEGRTPARIYLEDAIGPAWPRDATVRKDQHGNAFFHADGAFEALVSGPARLLAVRGMEYEPVEMTFDAPPEGRRSETVRLQRWSELAKDGWRSGDVHVHLHYGGEYLFDADDASLVQRGEDVHFMNMMVANQGSAFVHDRIFFEGRPNERSDDDHILRWGEEYRNDFLGHLCMYGLTDLVPPIYSGFRLSEHPHDVPANAVAADRCHEAGGTLSYAHPLFRSGDLDRVFERARTVEAKELPIDLMLGKVDALDIMSYPGSDLDVAELWYKLLDCGFRVPATAGTDTFMNLAGPGIFSNPPAGNRVFARTDGPFTTESWCQAVREGKTFVTNGPMLSLQVAGQPIGAEIEAEAGAVLEVHGEARSYAPIDRLELVVNGAIVAQAPAAEGGRSAVLNHALLVEGSCWVALRALGGPHPMVLGGPLFAHTSPVYVSVAGAPLRDAEAAAYFVEWIERFIAMCREHGRFADESELNALIDLFRSAQERYRALAGA